MTNVIFSRKEFEKEIKITEKILEKISLFGTPLERVDSEEIEIEVFPNRPDLISLQGFIRGFKTFIGKERGLRRYSVGKPKKDYEVKVSPSVKSVRPYTSCAIVTGLKLDDEKIKDIINLQEKLHITVGRNRKKVAIGIYPLEEIKLPIKYEARKARDISFVPLEEEREMSALQILKRNPTGKTYAHLLEGMDMFPIFVDSAGKILSMPPIINSADTGRVVEKTKDVFIECSGSDYKVLNKTLNIIVTALSEIGGKIHQMSLNYGNRKVLTPNLKTDKVKISLENVNRILGLNLKESDLERLLPKMGYEYGKGKVEVPSWRTDILHEIDIIEDIAIAYGYDNLEPEVPNIATVGEEDKFEKDSNKIRELMIGLGFLEISTYHLIKAEEAKSMKQKGLIELENSKTEYKMLRPDLLIPALRILSENKDNDYPQNVFEMGNVFVRDRNKDTGIKEDKNLIVVCSPGNFTKIKQILDYLFGYFGRRYEIGDSSIRGLIEGRTGDVKIDGRKIGYVGEVHPETLRTWMIKMPVVVLEISLDWL